MAEYPIGLFPAVVYYDPEWCFRVEHCAHLLGDSAGDMIRMMVRFMNAQLRHQELQRRGISTWLVRHMLLIASWIGKSLRRKGFRQ